MLQCLYGQWVLKRNSTDQSIMEGKATINSEGAYYEEGLFYRADGFVSDFWRRYHFFEGACAQELRINYDDGYSSGSPMHILKFRECYGLWHAYHEHSCKMDKYKLEMVVAPHASFSMVYDIQGPKKNYSIMSIYYKS